MDIRQHIVAQVTARILTVGATSECYALKTILMFFLEFHSNKICVTI
jgi:hypothetical protein